MGLRCKTKKNKKKVFKNRILAQKETTNGSMVMLLSWIINSCLIVLNDLLNRKDFVTKTVRLVNYLVV